MHGADRGVYTITAVISQIPGTLQGLVCKYCMDFAVMDAVRTLPPDSVLRTLLLAVIIAPVIWRWRLRLRRWLNRASLVAAGILIGSLL